MRTTLEIRMGEIAALLDDVAEALTHYPEEIVVVDDARDGAAETVTGRVLIDASAWPSIQELEQLLSNWRALRGVKPKPVGRPPAA
jgi:hypothetical protein